MTDDYCSCFEKLGALIEAKTEYKYKEDINCYARSSDPDAYENPCCNVYKRFDNACLPYKKSVEVSVSQYLLYILYKIKN